MLADGRLREWLLLWAWASLTICNARAAPRPLHYGQKMPDMTELTLLSCKVQGFLVKAVNKEPCERSFCHGHLLHLAAYWRCCCIASAQTSIDLHYS